MANAFDQLLGPPPAQPAGGPAAPGAPAEGSPPAATSTAPPSVDAPNLADYNVRAASGPAAPTTADNPVAQGPHDPIIGIPPALQAGLGGVAEAAFQAKDLLLGKQGEPSAVRSAIEENTARVNAMPGAAGTVNKLTDGIAQFGISFLGIGKVLKPLMYGTGLIAPGIAADAITGGVTGAAAFDPHEQRLDDLIQQHPALRNPVSEFLASKPDDSDAMGRFKNAVEQVVLPGAVAGVVKGVTAAARASVKVLTSAVEAIKLRRLGDLPGANAAAQEAQAALPAATKELPDAGPDTATPEATPVPDPTAGPGGSNLGPDVQPGAPATSAGGPTSPEAGRGADPAPDGRLEKVPGNESTRGTPAAKPQVDFTPEQMSGLIGKAQKDTGALLDAGSYAAAVADGHSFAESSLIPWQKFATGLEPVDAWMGRVVEEQGDYINKVRGGNADGVMTDAAVDKAVGRLVAAGGVDPALIRGLILQAGDQARTMVAKMDTAFSISQQAFVDSYGLVTRINAGNLAGFESMDAAVATAKARMVASLEMFASAKAMIAAGGRMVRRGQGQFNPGTMEALQASLAKINPQDFLDLVASTKGNPQAMADKVVPSAFSKVMDFTTMQQAAGLIWGWSTATVIAVADVSALYLRPLAAFVGAHFQVGRAVEAGDDALRASAASVRSQARQQMLQTHTFLEDGWQAAVNAFKQGDSRLAPHMSELQAAGNAPAPRMGSAPLTQAAANWVPVNSLHDLIYNTLQSAYYMGSNPREALTDVLGTPFRFHGALQEAMQTMRYRAVVTAKADAAALSMGMEPKTQPYLDHVENAVRDSFDANGAGTDLDALAESRASVFQSKLMGAGTDDTWGGLPTTGAVAQQVAASMPPLRLLAPYIAIPMNLFRYNVRLTPGLNILQKEYLQNLSGANGITSQAMATGEMGLGLLFGIKAIQMRMDGRLTGNGPSDPKMASSWRADGHQPGSIVSTDPDGTKHYFQLDRFDPYQAPFVFWADVTDILMQGSIKSADPSANPALDQSKQAIGAALIATMHLLKNKTMLDSLSQAMDAMQDDNKIKSFFQKWSPGVVVPGSSLWKETNPDPYLRELDGYFDGIKVALPGFVPGGSTSLPVRRDAYGDPVTIPGKFTSTRKDNGPLGNALDENYAATGHYPTPPSPTQGGIDLRDVTTEKGTTAYDRFQELAGHPTNGPSLKDSMTKVVQSAAYQGLTHGKPSEEGTRENALEKVMQAYHQGAMGALRQESPTVNNAMTQRARDIMGQNMTKQQDVRAAAAHGGAASLNSLLGQYGLGLPVPSAAVPAVAPQQ